MITQVESGICEGVQELCSPVPLDGGRGDACGHTLKGHRVTDINHIASSIERKERSDGRVNCREDALLKRW